MSFSQVVWKMAKAQYKKYLFYYLCNSFAVMFFFIFSTVYFNKQIVEVRETESIQYVLMVPGVALIVFTVIFISYAHNIFIRRRKSEFGLFMTLGMSSRDIGKLLLLENVLIAFSSLVSGILGGTIFSRLFFMLLIHSVGIQGISFHMNSNMYLSTIFIFLAVFSLAIGRSLLFVLESSLSVSLKNDKIKETAQLKSPFIGGVGAMVVLGSIIGLYVTYSNPTVSGEYLLLWSIATFLGLYLTIYQFTSFFIEVTKTKKTSYYYRRILFLTNLDYRFKQLTSVLMLVTVMVMITILYSTINLFTYMLAEREAIESNPYDIAYLQSETTQLLSEDELYSIIDQQNNPIEKYLEVPIFNYYHTQPKKSDSNIYQFMDLDSFQSLTSSKVELDSEEFIYYINADPEEINPREYYSNNAFLPNDKQFPALKEIVVERHINNLINVQDFIVLENSSFEKLTSRMEGYISSIHLINVADWKETRSVVDKLTVALENTSSNSDSQIESMYSSKIAVYEFSKHSNGILFFVTTILSIIFLFGSFMILYLHLFSDLDHEKEKFKKLQQIGITTQEVEQIISREIRTIIYLPTVIGTIIAFLYMAAMAKDVGGVMDNPQILLHFLLVASIYQVIQTGFYLYARKKMFTQLLS